MEYIDSSIELKEHEKKKLEELEATAISGNGEYVEGSRHWIAIMYLLPA